MERHSNSLTARNEQLENELTKIKAVAKGKRKPLALTIKQYQAFAAQLSDLHRTMVVTAMCTGMRVSEVLALRWDQLDFANRPDSPYEQGFLNGRIGEAKTGASKEPIPMDPVLAGSLIGMAKQDSEQRAGVSFAHHGPLLPCRTHPAGLLQTGCPETRLSGRVLAHVS